MSVQSSDELQPISNTKFPDKPEIIQSKFYDYNIRYLNAKTGKKFLVTDLLDQYAKNNNKQRIKLENYLRLQETKNFINVLNKEVHASDPRHDPKFTEDLRNNDILEKYSFEGYDLNISSEAYVMKEELLTDCLYWLDKTFAAKVTKFLTKLRNEDNDYLKNSLKLKRKTMISLDSLLTNLNLKTKN